MSLSFAAGHVTLSAWGFPASDVAILTGAGRAVGTWIMNQIKDQSLLEFMKVDAKDLIPRKGLVDINALHQRWDIQLVLLQNGNRRVIGGSTAAVVESMGIFSWFMTIVVSSLDAALQLSSMKRAMYLFLTALFEEHMDGLDYLHRELPRHIEGWLSAAIVRNIAQKARTVWQTLLDRKSRLPGNIPNGDIRAIVRLLVWIAGAKGQQHSKRFETASSDVFCIAMVLKSVGLDSIETLKQGDDTEVYESKLVVVYTPDVLGTKMPSGQEEGLLFTPINKRRGMRIPLHCMQECVSLWPGTAGENNLRRQLFEDGLAASKTLSVTTEDAEPSNRWISKMIYRLRDTALPHRVEGIAFRVASRLFPIATSYILERVLQITNRFKDWTVSESGDPLSYLQTNYDALDKIQALVLGYYYGMLSKLVDSSRLAIPEAYGSWKWYDDDLLVFISDMIAESGGEIFMYNSAQADFPREVMLKLIAVLFAGVEPDQSNALDSDSIGIHGKLSVVFSSLLGQLDFRASILTFSLLDTDPTAIPSTAGGILRSCSVHECEKLVSSAESVDTTLIESKEINLQSLGEDFTSQIEPDWENDVQQCMVAFRLKGRLIAQFPPGALDTTWAHRDQSAGETFNLKIPEKVYLPEACSLISGDHCNATTVTLYPTLFPTRGLLKARACLVTAYHGLYGLVILPMDFGLQWSRLIKSPNMETEHDQTIMLYQFKGTGPRGVGAPAEPTEPNRCIILL